MRYCNLKLLKHSAIDLFQIQFQNLSKYEKTDIFADIYIADICIFLEHKKWYLTSAISIEKHIL